VQGGAFAAVVERPLYFAFALAFPLPQAPFLSRNSPKMNQKPYKTKKNPKKPVETGEIVLTKPAERLKVNCGTVLRTRMNIDDRASFNGCFLIHLQAGKASGPEVYFEREKE
jgi:hypothetical protein